MKNEIKSLGVSAAILLLAAPSAFAGLIGDSMKVDYRYPDIATVYNSGQSFTGGSSFTYNSGQLDFNISVAVDTITISGFQIHNVAPGATLAFSGPPGSPNGATDLGVTFNGLLFGDLTHAFSSASIDSVTALPGFDLSRVSVNGGELGLNFMGLNCTGGQSAVVLHVDSLPDGGSTAGLFGLAMVAIVVVRRKQRA